MDFYFSPLACSMATRIAVAEAGGTINLIEIDPADKKVLATGEDYLRRQPARHGSGAACTGRRRKC